MVFRLAIALAAMLTPALGQDRATEIKNQIRAIDQIVASYGGYDRIDNQLKTLRAKVAEMMPPEGQFHHLTFGEMRFLPNLASGAPKMEWKEAYPAEDKVRAVEAILDLNRKLKQHGVDLILIPVPSKIEAYPEYFDPNFPEGHPVSPGRLKLMRHLLEQDVEVIDILPRLLQAKKEQNLPVYEVTGHHPSGYGAKVLGEFVAARLAAYHFTDCDPARFKAVQREATERVDPTKAMTAWEVEMDGQTYKHVDQSEIVVMGDSHAFAFWSASWASHIARALGKPITDLSISGGGPTAPRRLAGLGLPSLKTRRVVVWIVTSQALDRGTYTLADFQEKPGLAGLVLMGKYEEAIAKCAEWRKSDPEKINLSESDFNYLGYALARTNKLDEAVVVMQLQVTAFPESANAWDSYGEILLQAERKEDAIAALKKSLSMNPPENTRKNSIKLLARLGIDVAPHQEFQLDERQMGQLVGGYMVGDTTPANVFNESGKLYFQMKHRPRFRLWATSATTFTTDEGIHVSFEKDDQGDMKLAAELRGKQYHGKRISNELLKLEE